MTILVALHWAFSIMLMSFMSWGARNRMCTPDMVSQVPDGEEECLTLLANLVTSFSDVIDFAMRTYCCHPPGPSDPLQQSSFPYSQPSACPVGQSYSNPSAGLCVCLSGSCQPISPACLSPSRQQPCPPVIWLLPTIRYHLQTQTWELARKEKNVV